MPRSEPRRKSLRIKGYDYSAAGNYFVTICTERGKCILGNVFGGQFDASEAGKIVGECWLELPYHYAGLHLDAFVVMPNHVHGLLIFEDAVGAGLRPAPTKIKRRSLPEVV